MEAETEKSAGVPTVTDLELLTHPRLELTDTEYVPGDKPPKDLEVLPVEPLCDDGPERL